MPTFDFDAALREYRQDDPDPPEPIAFVYGGERFEVVAGPTLGDVMELHDAPEIVNETDEAAALAILKFVRRLLPVADRQRFDAAHFSIPARQAAPAMIRLGTWITEQVTGFPTKPPDSSATVPPSNGRTSSKRTGGNSHSSRRQPGKASSSSTARQSGT